MPSLRPDVPIWQERLYAFMTRNAVRAPEALELYYYDSTTTTPPTLVTLPDPPPAAPPGRRPVLFVHGHRFDIASDHDSDTKKDPHALFLLSSQSATMPEAAPALAVWVGRQPC